MRGLLRSGRGRRRGGQGRAGPAEREVNMAVLLETTLGDLVIDLYTEERPRGRSAAGRARGSRALGGGGAGRGAGNVRGAPPCWALRGAAIWRPRRCPGL